MMQRLKAQGGILKRPQVRELLDRRDGKLESLMTDLLLTAAGYATAPVSGFSVGAVAAGMPDTEGTPALYLGANLEFGSETLDGTIHAEQAAVFNAWTSGETGVAAIAVTAAPCGYCRQFLWELSTAAGLVVWSPGAPGEPPVRRLLTELLPAAFGPADLGVEGGFMSSAVHRLELETNDGLIQTALDAARRSYAPYSKTYAGCAIEVGPGRVIAAPYAENAAFNPSVTPLGVALAVKNIRDPEARITNAALVESAGMISHRGATERLLAGVAPGVRLRVGRGVA